MVDAEPDRFIELQDLTISIQIISIERMNTSWSLPILVLVAYSCICSLASSPDERSLQTQASYNATFSGYSSSERRKASEASGSNDLNQLQQQGQSSQDGDLRVPYWNIAHMINSISQIEKVLR